MNNSKTGSLSFKKGDSTATTLYYLTLLALAAGFGLSIVSWLRICSEACSEGHSYRLYGFTFESVGIPFFGVLLLAQLLSQRIPSLTIVARGLISSAFGAEIMFTYAQKYIIGHWCPVCLSIAASVVVAFLFIAYQYTNELLLVMKDGQKEAIMEKFLKGVLCVFLALCGFFFSQAGLAKYNQLQAAEDSIKDSIAFGNLKSPVEVYVFTDWECPSCRKAEPAIEQASPDIMKEARLIFVDLPVHPESMNFTPYNLSFMIKNKAQYFRLRDMLSEISERTKAPTDEQVEAQAKKLGVAYHQLNYADVAMGLKYFKHLAKQFNVDRTPTVVIVNKDKKKGKKLIGAGEINKANIMKAIQSLSN